MSTTVTHDDGTTIETNARKSTEMSDAFSPAGGSTAGVAMDFLVDGKQAIENHTAHHSSLQSAVTLKFIFSGSRAMKSSRITFAASETKVSSDRTTY